MTGTTLGRKAYAPSAISVAMTAGHRCSGGEAGVRPLLAARVPLLRSSLPMLATLPQRSSGGRRDTASPSHGFASSRSSSFSLTRNDDDRQPQRGRRMRWLACRGQCGDLRDRPRPSGFVGAEDDPEHLDPLLLRVQRTCSVEDAAGEVGDLGAELVHGLELEYDRLLAAQVIAERGAVAGQ